MTAEELAAKICAAKKYADICPAAVLRVARTLQGRYPSDKAWEKAVKERLHGLTGAFVQGGRGDIDVSDGDEALEALLRQHASTRERLPLSRMDSVYGQIFRLTGSPESILDLACGLNPVYLRARWPLCRVLGIDVSRRCAELSGGVWGDLLQPETLPGERFHIALMLKLLPLLEREREGAGAELLHRVNAEYAVVSFPTRTLSGRNVGMARHYGAWLREHMPGNRREAGVLETENEIYYVLKETEPCRV